MKKALKIIIVIFASLLIITIGLLIYYFAITNSVKFTENKLINLERKVSFYDKNGELFAEEFGDTAVTELISIPKHVQNAFISIEDKRFYKHNGVDYKGLIRALFNNTKTLSFKQGASTISQQLIKNTHLTNDKTIKRKLCEIRLTKSLEKNYSKDKILETYLNTIYFGENCYGIASASQFYFNKNVSDLTIFEGATLAAIIKAPSTYSPIVNIEKCKTRRNLVLLKMYEQGYITKTDYEKNINEEVIISNHNANKENYKDYLYLVKRQLSDIIGASPYVHGSIKVYTNFDKEKQKTLEELLSNNDLDYNKSALLINNKSKICAYYSTCGEAYRQMGSIFKPICVYAPGIDCGAVYSCTQILDEKTDFNGYSPSNYADKYFGYISVKEAFSKSSNVCSVKILNSIGIEKSLNYINKFDFSLTKNDNSLSLALGATEKGAKLTQIVGAYTVFNNDGKYIKPFCIEKITDDENIVFYNNNNKETEIFSDGTCSLVNDMAKLTVQEGTAKKLSYNSLDLYAKTGTVGNSNGNSDAYCISYNSEYVLGVWFGDKGDLMPNSITGGGIPTIISSSIWEEIYKNNVYPNCIDTTKGTKEISIDKISYFDNHILEIADDIAPSRYIIIEKFKDTDELQFKSNRFIFPIINDYKISVNKSDIVITLCLTEYTDAEIYRIENNNKIKVYDTFHNNKEVFIDKNLTAGRTYSYTIIPYYKKDNEIYNGKEIFTEKIKSPSTELGEDWWIDDLL